MTRTSMLWRLQVIDQELDDKIKRARQVDEDLAHDPVVAAARAEFETEQKGLAEKHRSMRTREQEAASLDAKIKELEQRLYSGQVSNPKELDGLEKDLQMHKRNRSELDDKILTLMDSVDQVQKQLLGKTERLKQTESARAGEVNRLGREKNTLGSRLNDLETERDETRRSIDSDALRQYDRLRKTKGSRALAQLRANSCAACGVEVPSGLVQRVRAGEEIVLCSGCGRILAQ